MFGYDPQNFRRTMIVNYNNEVVLDSGNSRKLAAMKSQSQKLDDLRKRLEDELESLSVKNESLEKQLEDQTVCKQLFSNWSGRSTVDVS